MRSICVGFSRDVFVEDLVALLRGMNWHRVDSRLVVENGKVAVYLDIDMSEIDPADDWWLGSSLGGFPHARVDVHVGRGGGSDRLAAEVVRRLVAFGGVVDPESDGLAALGSGSDE